MSPLTNPENKAIVKCIEILNSFPRGKLSAAVLGAKLRESNSMENLDIPLGRLSDRQSIISKFYSGSLLKELVDARLLETTKGPTDHYVTYRWRVAIRSDLLPNIVYNVKRGNFSCANDFVKFADELDDIRAERNKPVYQVKLG